MNAEIILHFRDGKKLDGRLCRPFSCDEGEIEVLLAGDAEAFIFSLEELSVILFLSDSGLPVISTREEDVEEVEVLAGELFTIHSDACEGGSAGFFALPALGDAGWRYAYFVSRGIRLRIQKRPVGRILSDSGFITDSAVTQALHDQECLRARRVGGIISEKYHISQDLIDKTLSDSSTGGTNHAHAKVGDVLVAAGLVTRQQVAAALKTQEAGKKMKIGTLLVERKLISEEQLLYALATKYCLRLVDLQSMIPTPEALALLSRGIVNRLQVMPLAASPRQIVVATSNPTDISIGDRLRFLTNRYIEFVVASEGQIAAAIEQYYNCSGAGDAAVSTAVKSPPAEVAEPVRDEVSLETRVSTLISSTLLTARQKGVSTIHFEPGSGSAPLIIRYRIEADCFVADKVSGFFAAQVVAGLKKMSGLDITERRRPQSGKIFIDADGVRYEYRLEITPTVGTMEDAVIHLLGPARVLPLAELGFSADERDRIEQILAAPSGMFLCVGPPWSGKSTCLHGALEHINSPARKIFSAEDSVVLRQRGLRQVQVNPGIGFTYTEALASFLRADADVIMLGDISEPTIAAMALDAALRGHLLLSSLSTGTAAEAIVRLMDMGASPFRLADGLLGVVARRLVRRLCEQCKQPYHPAREEYEGLVSRYDAEDFSIHGVEAFHSGFTLQRRQGCTVCNGSGYKGVIPLHELLTVTPRIKEAVGRKASLKLLRETALQEGMRTLQMDGIRRIFAGETDLTQLNRACF